MADQPSLPPRALRCDVPGCREETAVKLGNEQRCYCHALERGNELRAARGLPPITYNDGGLRHGIH